jgi:hypothetical protein
MPLLLLLRPQLGEVRRHLFGEEDRLLTRRQRVGLAQLRHLGVVDPLRVHALRHVPAEPLLVVDEPALAVDGNDRDLVAGDEPAILEYFRARQHVFVDPAASALLRRAPPALRLEIRRLAGLELVLPDALLLVGQPVREHQQRLRSFLDLVIFGLDHDVGREPLENRLDAGLGPVRRLAWIFILERFARIRGEHEPMLAVGLVEQLGVGIEIDPLVGVDDDHARVDALLFAVEIELVRQLVAQAIGAETAGRRFLEGVVARLLGLEMVAVRPVDAVERVGRLRIGIRSRRTEIRHDPVRAIVLDDLLDALAQLVDLDADAVRELVAPRSLPHGAGNRDEAPAEQRMGANVGLRDRGRVEPLQRPLVDLLQALAVGVWLFGNDLGHLSLLPLTGTKETVPFARSQLLQRRTKRRRFPVAVPLPAAFPDGDGDPALIAATARAADGKALDLAITLAKLDRARLLPFGRANVGDDRGFRHGGDDNGTCAAERLNNQRERGAQANG